MSYNQPLITVHLEASNIPELMGMLDDLMGNLANHGIAAHGAPRLSDDLASIQVDTTKAQAAPKTRPRGKKNAEQEPSGATEAEPAPTPAASTMLNLSPAEARLKGIGLIQTFFAGNPGVLPQITAISAKYGVSAFADVKDEEAHKFLADITLIVSGNGEVA